MMTAAQFSGLVLAALVQFAGILIWGANLTARVKVIESEIEPLKTLSIQFARLETKMDVVRDQLKDLNASIRWMREPAQFTQHGTPR